MNISDNCRSALKLVASKRPLVIGHRGFSQMAPENTLPSFKLAMAAGADLVELDYHQSKDDQLVVIHDAELDRTTDAVIRWGGDHFQVANRTAAEIQSLDGGSWFDSSYGGTKIPLLSEALDTIRDGGVALIERKAGDPADCLRLLESKNMINKVVVQAFDWQFLRTFHQLCSVQVLAALGPPSHTIEGSIIDERRVDHGQLELNAKRLEELGKTGAKVAVWNRRVSKQAIKLAHDRNLKVWIYTVDDSVLANRLLDIGVDGLITNNTSLMWRTLALRAIGPS
jgi:glycerophosphoryl diester phosphodiesterase